MNVNRVILLCLDGLEASIIETGDFPNIKQVEHGRISIPIMPVFNNPATPVIWTSLITGKDPLQHGVPDFFVWENPLLRYLQRRFYGDKLLAKIHKFNLKLGVGKVLRKLGFKKIHVSKEHITSETLFDIIKPSIPISVPVINEDVVDIYGDIEEVGLRKTLETGKLHFEREKLQLFNSLNKPWKLLMAHFMIADIYGHLFYKSIDKIVKLYEKLDRLVGEVKKRLDENTLCLVLSDHGTIDKHTKYGFYSSNIPLGLNNPKMTDFYHLVLKLISNANHKTSAKNVD